MPTCPLCHATLPPNQTCQDLFHHCLELEFEHPSTFGAVHHLTVLCYSLQHNLYSPQGWLEGRRLLARYVREGASPAEVCKQAGPRLQTTASLAHSPQSPHPTSNHSRAHFTITGR